MKKVLFYLFGAASLAVNLNAQNVNIPDANFKNFLISKTTINTNKDTEIQVSEAIAYSSDVNVKFKNIANLTGIEAFTNIKQLYVSSNQLTTIDISKNIALKDFECDFNKLTTLDVSKNIALTNLICTDNDITSLDVSKNTLLESLECKGNDLKTIDVSKNIVLNSLFCSVNQLTTLDVSKNIALYELKCGNNEFTNLDISKNTALNYLDCPYNLLTKLDVSKNTALKSIVCSRNKIASLDISKNTALTYYDCSYNLFASLDVSKNTSLNYLYCQNNLLKALDVSKNTSLNYLNCRTNYLTNLNIKNGANAKLQKLEAESNPDLKCIQVDDPTKIGADWYKEATATYSKTCNVSAKDAIIVENLSLYPNPASHTLNLRWEGDVQILHVALLNSVGAVVKSQNIENQGNINIEDLPHGLYFCQLSDANRKTQTVKVVVE